MNRSAHIASLGQAAVFMVALALVSAGCAHDRGTGSHDDPHATHDHAKHGEHTGHHAHHHRFEDAEKWAARFEDPARDAWQRPNAVLERLTLRDDTRVADIGSGTGYFAVRLARWLPEGFVYGIDVEPDMVRYLNERAAKEGLTNLESRLGKPHDPKIPEPVHLVLVVNTYHHMQERTRYFERVAEKLAPGGRVVIVDFKPGELEVGPPPEMKIPTGQIIEELEAAGYELNMDDRELLPYQDLLVFVRPPE